MGKKPRSKKKKLEDLIANFSLELEAEAESTDNVSELFGGEDLKIQTQSYQAIDDKKDFSEKKPGKFPTENSSQRTNTNTYNSIPNFNAANPREPKVMHKQSVNNKKSNDYVNKYDYVNNAEPKRSAIKPDYVNRSALKNTYNKALHKPNDYVNKYDYVNNAKSNKTGVRSNYVNNANIFQKSVNKDVSENTKSGISPESCMQSSPGSVRNQNNNNSLTARSIQERVFSLAKKERLILDELFDLCLSTNSQTTPKVRYDHIAQRACTTVNTAKTLIKRLTTKEIVNRVQNSYGPGAWTIYSIPETVYSYLLSEFRINRKQSVINAESSIQSIRSSSSNNSLLNNITNNTKPKVKELPEDWLLIQVPENLKAGFGKTQLKQLLNLNLSEITSELIQSSLDGLSYDIDSGVDYAQKNRYNKLMGLLRKGQAWVSEKMIEEEEELFQRQEKLRQRKAELDKKKSEENLKEKFEKWLMTKSQEEINSIVPPTDLVEEGSFSQTMMLREYFENKEI
jgi:hypothetical protein